MGGIKDYKDYRLDKTPLRNLLEGLPWEEIERLAKVIGNDVATYGQNFELRVDRYDYIEITIRLSDAKFGDLELMLDREGNWFPVSVNPMVTRMVE